MSVLPHVHNGRVCIPWWYGLGYPLVWVLVGIGISERDTMETLSTEVIIALVVCAFVGAIIYTLLYGISQYKKQKLDAAKVREAIVASGRDPTNPAVLTAQEKWDLQKVQKFDRIFLIGMIVGIILATILAVCVGWFYAHKWIGDTWQEWAVAGFILGLVGAWFVNETVVKLATSGEWADKASKAFQTVAAAVEDPAALTLLEQYIERYMSAGMSKKEAIKTAQEYIANHPELIQ